MHTMESYRRIRARFLLGPGWLNLPDWLTIRKLHYRSATLMLAIWAIALFDRAVSMPGRVILPVFLITAFFSTVVLNSPVVFVFFCLTAVLVIDFAAGLLFRPKLMATRQFPDRIRCGIPFQVRYTIQNLRKLPCWDLHVDQYFRFRGMVRCEDVPSLDIEGGGTAKAEIRCMPLRRGIYPIGKSILESRFPFNVFKFSQVSGQLHTLICHPAYQPFETIRELAGDGVRRQGLMTLPHTGEGMDFHGCRDFRYGDARRRIHWRASAKFDSLIVKEFQEECQSSASIIVDNIRFNNKPSYRGIQSVLKWVNMDLSRKDPAFESAVSLAASLADSLIRRNYLLDYLVVGRQMVHLRNRQAEATPEIRVMDQLAAAERVIRDPLLHFSQGGIEELAQSGSVFLILLRADQAAADFYEKLIQLGVPVHAYVIVSGDTQAPEWAKAVTPEQILPEEIR